MAESGEARTDAGSTSDRAQGILPAEAIRRLVANRQVIPGGDLARDQIQPASLDLRLGRIAYRVRASFLPGPRHTVKERLDPLKLHQIDLTSGAVLETGCVYIVPLLEELRLPAHLAADANPKSSTGRLDIFTRVIADTARGGRIAGRGRQRRASPQERASSGSGCRSRGGRRSGERRSSRRPRHSCSRASRRLPR